MSDALFAIVFATHQTRAAFLLTRSHVAERDIAKRLFYYEIGDQRNKMAKSRLDYLPVVLLIEDETRQPCLVNRKCVVYE